MSPSPYKAPWRGTGSNIRGMAVLGGKLECTDLPAVALEQPQIAVQEAGGRLGQQRFMQTARAAVGPHAVLQQTPHA